MRSEAERRERWGERDMQRPRSKEERFRKGMPYSEWGVLSLAGDCGG